MDVFKGIGLDLGEIKDLMYQLGVEAVFSSDTTNQSYYQPSLKIPNYLENFVKNKDNPRFADFYKKNDKGLIIISTSWYYFVEFLRKNGLIEEADLYMLY